MALTTQEKLEAAEEAMHQLMIGKSIVSMKDEAGKEVTYTRANLADLKKYIMQLKAIISSSRRRRCFKLQTSKGL